MLYPAAQEGPFEIPYHDPDTIREIGLLFRPELWEAGRVYMRTDASNYDAVLPTVFKGFYHRVANSGKSNATVEPIWAKRPNDLTEDFEAGETDGLVWEAIPYNLLLPSESIANVEFTPFDGVTLLSTAFDTRSATFVLDAIPLNTLARTQGFFTVHIHAIKTNGKTFDATFKIILIEH